MKTKFVTAIISITTGIILHAGMACAAPPDSPNNAIPLALRGAMISPEQLKSERARGELVITAATSGTVSGDTVGSNTVTGNIADSQSISGNAGITTVLQNTGNNALVQSSTAIYVSEK